MKRLISIIAIVIIVALCLPVSAMALESAVKPSTFECEVISGNPNAGSVNKVDKGDNVYEITAIPAKGYQFVGWSITGDYTIKEGSTKDKVVIIAITEDVRAVANFNAKPSDPDKDPDSPISGDNVYLYVVACFAALAGAGFAFKKARA